jgi:putative ABC transport system permease protein
MIPEIRYAVRQLLRSPGFTAFAVLTLALGIGVNATMFSVLNTLIFRAAPFGDPGRLVDVFTSGAQSQYWQWSPAEVHDIRDESTVFESFAANSWWSPSMAEPGQPAERLAAMPVGDDFLPMLKVAPAMGRLFTPEEKKVGGVAVVTNRFWQRRLGGDPHAVGRVVRLDGKPYTVVGVMPPSLDDPVTWGRLDLWVPMAYDAKGWAVRNAAWLSVTARLKPGVTLAQAQAEMDALAARYAHDYPQFSAERGIHIESLERRRVDAVSRRMSWLVMDLTLSVLLIACVNLANLQLVRTTGHAREHAIRLALGSSRWRLIRQLLAESLIVSLAGGALGLLVARWGNAALGSRILVDGADGLDLPVDLRVIGFALVASAITGAVFGIVPAWIASGADASAALKQGGRGMSGDRSRHRLRHLLIVSEIAIALALLAGAGYFVRGTQRLVNRDFGFRPENLLIGSMDLTGAKYDKAGARRHAYDQLRADLGALPGVTRVAVSAGHPATDFHNLGDIAVEGRPVPKVGTEPLAFSMEVSPGFFGTVGMRLLQGREFTDRDLPDTPRVVIVNEAMAKELWPGENAIGKRIGTGERAARDWNKVVGVVNDITLPLSVFQPPETRFQTYTPIYREETPWITFSVRGSSDPRLLEDAVRKAVARIDPEVAIYGLESAEERIGQWMANFALISWVLARIDHKRE